PNVPDSTRDKVMHVIAEMGYEPNTSAQILAGKANNTIGLFVVSIYDRDNIYQSSYYSSIINAAVDASNSSGYYVLIHTVYSDKDYYRISQTFLQKRISGGILVGNEKDTAQIKKLMKTGVPIGIVDYDLTELEGAQDGCENLVVINSDDYEASRKAVHHLYALGRRRIGVMVGRLQTFSGRQRYQGYLDAMRSLALTVDERLVLHGDFVHSVARKETLRMLANGSMPDAIVSCNDDMAIAAMEVLRENGIAVPEDVSIVGFDDTPLAAQTTPRLSTFRVPLYKMVTQVTEKVIANIEGQGKGFESENLPLQFMERDSCCAASSKVL
ncbi:MAG: LacI family DNA-binding transcriptional regulator, partial [Acetanaerobacterium sp.]